MITDFLLIFISLIALSLASLSDIRTREVPDYLTYSFIIIALFIRLIHSITFNQYSYILYGLLGLVSMYLFGNLLYYTKLWGGGDSKLLMGLGTAFATKPFFLPETKVPFLIILILTILVVGGIYGLIYSITLSIKHWRKFKEKYKEIKEHFYLTRLVSMILSLLLVLLSFMTNLKTRIGLLLSAALIYFYVHITIFIKAVEFSCLLKNIPVSKLTEGDWIANKNIIKKFKIPNTGIELKQIKALIKSKIKSVEVKEGIPFVPPFLIGTLILLFTKVIYFFV